MSKTASSGSASGKSSSKPSKGPTGDETPSPASVKLSATELRLMTDNIKLQQKILRREEGVPLPREAAASRNRFSTTGASAAATTTGPSAARQQKSSVGPGMGSPQGSSGSSGMHTDPVGMSGGGGGLSSSAGPNGSTLSFDSDATGSSHPTPASLDAAAARRGVNRFAWLDVTTSPAPAGDEINAPTTGSSKPTDEADSSGARPATYASAISGTVASAACSSGMTPGESLAAKRAILREACRPDTETSAMKASRTRSNKKQPYDLYLVLDVEATCEEHERDFPNEIIEFPVVLIESQSRSIIDIFHSYVRPVKHPKITPFCTELTGIKQTTVDSAPTLPHVLASFEAWLDRHTNNGELSAIFATDGPWDLRHFMHKCHVVRDGLVLNRPHLYDHWVNIRKTFSSFYKTRPLNLGQMLTRSGMDFHGRQHSGIDDAKNIARLALSMMERGCVFSSVSGLEREDLEIARMARLIEGGDCADDAAEIDAEAAMKRPQRNGGGGRGGGGQAGGRGKQKSRVQ